MTLKSVRKGRDLRCGAMRAREGWKCGAKMKVKGMRAMKRGVPAVGAGKTQPSDWRMSAEPDKEVDARPPCWGGEMGSGGREGGAYFDYPSTCASCDDRCSRADVECVVPVSTCSDDVDDKVLVGVLERRLVCTSAKHLCGCCEDFRSLFYPVDVCCGKKGPDLRRRDKIGEEMFEGEPEVVRGEICGCFDELLQQRFERVV